MSLRLPDHARRRLDPLGRRATSRPFVRHDGTTEGFVVGAARHDRAGRGPGAARSRDRPRPPDRPGEPRVGRRSHRPGARRTRRHRRFISPAVHRRRPTDDRQPGAELRRRRPGAPGGRFPHRCCRRRSGPRRTGGRRRVRRPAHRPAPARGRGGSMAERLCAAARGTMVEVARARCSRADSEHRSGDRRTRLHQRGPPAQGQPRACGRPRMPDATGGSSSIPPSPSRRSDDSTSRRTCATSLTRRACRPRGSSRSSTLADRRLRGYEALARIEVARAVGRHARGLPAASPRAPG